MVNTQLKVFDLMSGTDLICKNINVNSLRIIAKAYGFAKEPVEKILLGPDRYNFIRGNGYTIMKRFVTKVQYDQVKFDDWSPQYERVNDAGGVGSTFPQNSKELEVFDLTYADYPYQANVAAIDPHRILRNEKEASNG
jgi:hypothetical protein